MTTTAKVISFLPEPHAPQTQNKASYKLAAPAFVYVSNRKERVNNNPVEI